MSPFKPTREDAASVEHPEDMSAQALSPDKAVESHQVLGEGRQSRGGNEGNERHPPHVTENSQESAAQQQQGRPGNVEPLGANAAGTELIELNEEARAIDSTSAYAHRPEEDKDRPPSGRVDDTPSSPVD